MKKIFTLFAAMLVAAVVFAADQYPDPKVTNSLATAVSDVGNGETVWLDDSAVYVNAYGVDYTKLKGSKSFTIRAKAGENPVIKLEVPIQVRETANVKFIGVKFDGSNITKYSYLFDMYDATDNVLEFEDCEFTNLAVYVIRAQAGKKAAKIVFDNCYLHDLSNRILNQGTMGKVIATNCKFEDITKYAVFDNYDGATIERLQLEKCEFVNLDYEAIHNTSTSHIDTCIVNNCYFHNSKRSAIFFEAPASAKAQVDTIAVTNSTFAKYTAEAYYASIIDIRNGGSQTALGKVLVDHCTFYDCRTVNTDHVAIRVHKSTDATISNCVFMDPTESVGVYERSATHLYGGKILNCIANNYIHAYATKSGHWTEGATTVDNCSTLDPLFQDAENGDYTLSYGSPALTAGTDGKAIGDPRWVPNFYLTGTAAGATGAWNGHEIACAGTSYTIKNLAAGSYQLKLTRNGTWEGDNNVYGYDALSAKIGGLYRGTGDANDNICFTLADAGDVKVTFIYDEPLVFKVEGDFEMQNIQLGGSWASGEWGDDLRTFEPSEDKLTATLTMHFTSNYYEFKVVENGTWNGKWAGADDKHYYYTRTVTSADNFEENKQTLVITPDVEGDYVFTWTYATRVLEVAFPAAPDTTYYIAGSFTDWGNNKVEMNESAGTWSKTININTTENLEYKVVRVAGFSEVWYGLANASSMTKDNCTDWVIGGGEKPVGITTDETGDYTFIFNPAETKVSLVYPSATAVDNTVAGEKAVKVLRNGQLFIEKNGKTYNVLGTIVK